MHPMGLPMHSSHFGSQNPTLHYCLYTLNSTACSDGDIRLVSTTNNPLQGRLEACVNNNWGTVCEHGFGIPDANVACGQLGFWNSSMI